MPQSNMQELKKKVGAVYGFLEDSYNDWGVKDRVDGAVDYLQALRSDYEGVAELKRQLDIATDDEYEALAQQWQRQVASLKSHGFEELVEKDRQALHAVSSSSSGRLVAVASLVLAAVLAL